MSWAEQFDDELADTREARMLSKVPLSKDVTNIDKPRLRKVRRNLNEAMRDLAVLATEPGAAEQTVWAGLSVDRALGYLDEAEGTK